MAFGLDLVALNRGYEAERQRRKHDQGSMEEGVSSRMELPSQLCSEMLNTFKSLLITKKFYFGEALKEPNFQ